jgi:16S rRNA U516 pseudouridylate synthase RsuA-like enzyme
VVDITIHEGRNRQVRRMLAALGLGVRTLERIRYGPLDLGTLRPGAWRPLRPREVEQLRRLSHAGRTDSRRQTGRPGTAHR